MYSLYEFISCNKALNITASLEDVDEDDDDEYVRVYPLCTQIFDCFLFQHVPVRDVTTKPFNHPIRCSDKLPSLLFVQQNVISTAFNVIQKDLGI